MLNLGILAIVIRVNKHEVLFLYCLTNLVNDEYLGIFGFLPNVTLLQKSMYMLR